MNHPTRILAFGAHPDDIEFGCGGVIALETSNGSTAHFVVCSKGEAASNGTPEIRESEARRGAELLGATISFLDLGGDAHFEPATHHALAIARIIREHRPAIVLAPTLVENQHPDHAVLAKLVQRAARLARYGGLAELVRLAPHAINHLLYYAVTPDAEPKEAAPIYIDVSAVLACWQSSMEAHGSQSPTRAYVDLQLTRARLNGARATCAAAIPLFPNDPILVPSLGSLGKGVRNF